MILAGGSRSTGADVSDSLIQLQSLGTYRVPAWFTEENNVFDDVLEDFSHGLFSWDQSVGYVLRLFNDLWVPDFAVATVVGSISASAWVAPAVALTGVAREDGYCKADGVRFPAVSASVNPLKGAAVYDPGTGRVVWAATKFYGNLPVLAQDVYICWDSNFGAIFRL